MRGLSRHDHAVPMFSLRVPDDLARRFDALADGGGGRSALLRRLIADAVGSGPAMAAARGRRDAARLMVRLGPVEAGHVEAQAAAMGLRRAGWVAALVRRHASRRPTLARDEELAVLAIQAEVHRIGINVNQIARALNTAVLEGRVLELQLAQMDALRAELREHLRALREAFAGNLDYWDAP